MLSEALKSFFVGGMACIPLAGLAYAYIAKPDIVGTVIWLGVLIFGITLLGSGLRRMWRNRC